MELSVPRSSVARAAARKDWSLLKASAVVQKRREKKSFSALVLFVFPYSEFYDLSVGLHEI